MVTKLRSYPSAKRLDATFAALADPTRRAILARLATGEATVADLARPFKMSQPAVSKHLKVLERAGLISAGKDAQRRPRRIEPKPLAEATMSTGMTSRMVSGLAGIWTWPFKTMKIIGAVVLKPSFHPGNG